MRRTHAPYSSEVKARVLTRLLPPNPEPLRNVSLSENISEPTLRHWLAQASGEKEEYDEQPGPNDSSGLSSEQKFLVVLATVTMDETALGEYARSHGLYVEDIKRWIQNCQHCNTSMTMSDEPVKVKNLRAEIKECRATLAEKDAEIKRLNTTISERDRTIAEESALIFLQKKTFQMITAE